MAIDWDKLLEYQTVKVVKIRDKRLGILHLLFMLGIVIYIIVGTIILQKRYLATENPIGSIRATLLAPKYRNPTPPYCTSSGNSTYNGYPTYECEYWDESLVLYPSTSDTSMFISTRVESEIQKTVNNCQFTSPTCTYATYNQSLFYIPDIENFTIMLDHTVSAPNLGIQYNARQLPGRLLNSSGHVWTPPAPNVVGVQSQYDIMTVGTCLAAAGIYNLDGPSLSNASRSMRDDGVILLVFITYSNTYTYNTNNFRYTYQFKVIKDTKFKAEEPIFTTDVNNRYVFDRHGVKMLFIQTGSIGKFDFQTMLLTFVSGIGLVTVSTIFVDILAVRLLPQKRLYAQYKYENVEEMDERNKVVYENDNEDGAKTTVHNQ
ncbi:hypothetical protein SAMD00019534_027220 [Acytostelium subglobosum LB1]|uniref:hypothetical protein n=1 Tax=Acytostelium subglobosum LB1 TaxID=1410327 RepID=UPI0006451F54|nr:hypothetical protein SAMD00019534_027220 [Acytostelium subglobosum LB1]GAM19547.1 hypothetical protein SAMD00019534_027220 [Acytostelium subglobosum LB1]|eukprot:XP_012757474.1 hypothetical protein SAMD00019534_027220 [Acytostelium subglobosum LB1]